MNRGELRKRLEQKDIKLNSYSLEPKNFDPDESLCLRQEEAGWVVYYSERGLQAGKQSFKSESEACAYVLKELQDDPTTRKDWASGYTL
jgi:hypothetical protein